MHKGQVGESSLGLSSISDVQVLYNITGYFKMVRLE